jgi:hypothetical protein
MPGPSWETPRMQTTRQLSDAPPGQLTTSQKSSTMSGDHTGKLDEASVKRILSELGF